MRKQRMVELDERYQRHGKRSRLWGYGYADLAGLYGVSEGWLRTQVGAGRLNPGRLEEVVRYWGERVLRERAREGSRR